MGFLQILAGEGTNEDVQATLSRLNVSNRVITAVLTANRLSWTKARHWAAYFKREHMLGTARLTS